MAFPCLYLVACYHQRYHSTSLRWPYPFFAQLTTPVHGAAFVAAIVGLLTTVTAVFQTARDRVWSSYVVPKHLQLQS